MVQTVDRRYLSISNPALIKEAKLGVLAGSLALPLLGHEVLG